MVRTEVIILIQRKVGGGLVLRAKLVRDVRQGKQPDTLIVHVNGED